MVLTGLHLHHTGEDELLWPKLLERCTPDAALVHRMEAQHERVDAAIQKLGPALTRWEAEARPAVTEEVAAGFDELGTALLEHLDDEEREILPLAARHITQAEWNQLGEHGQKEMRKKDLPILFGAVFEEATPEERVEMLGVVPAPVRFLLRTVFAKKYRALHQAGARGALIVPASRGTSSGRNPRPRSQARRNASSPSSVRTAASHCRANSRSGGKVTATDPASAVADPAANSSAASSCSPRRAATTASPGTV